MTVAPSLGLRGHLGGVLESGHVFKIIASRPHWPAKWGHEALYQSVKHPLFKSKTNESLAKSVSCLLFLYRALNLNRMQGKVLGDGQRSTHRFGDVAMRTRVPTMGQECSITMSLMLKPKLSIEIQDETNSYMDRTRHESLLT